MGSAMDGSLLLRLAILLSFGRAMLLDRTFAVTVLEGFLPMTIITSSRKTAIAPAPSEPL